MLQEIRLMEEKNKNVERHIRSLQMEKEIYEDLIREHNQHFLRCRPILNVERQQTSLTQNHCSRHSAMQQTLHTETSKFS